MLKELFIHNIILVEDERILFQEGFTAISGETGSGKSAVMEALKLALGAKQDASLIRNGEESAYVEAIFEVERTHPVVDVLSSHGIDVEDDHLIIKRTISLNGKSKAFINHQAAQNSLLKCVGELLIEVVSQHSNHRFFSLDEHRKILDLYAGATSKAKDFSFKYRDYILLKKTLEEKKGFLPQGLRNIDACHREIEEIEEANLENEDEDALFEAYTRLSSSEERKAALLEVQKGIGQEGGALFHLNRLDSALRLLKERDKKASEILSPLDTVILELKELQHELRLMATDIEEDPEETARLELRLSEINRMKRKYGRTVIEIQNYLIEKKKELAALSNLEEEIQELEAKAEAEEKQVLALGLSLSMVRQKTLSKLAEDVTRELHALNMPHAEFIIKRDDAPLSQHGIDRIEFFVRSNIGENSIPLKDGASGGEIARISLALHTLLAGKEGLGTLILDEIDANIGGKTASLMAEKLKELGKSLQVIAITHFAQVAKEAAHHIQVAKKVEKGRTFSQIERLDLAGRKLELARMQGKL